MRSLGGKQFLFDLVNYLPNLITYTEWLKRRVATSVFFVVFLNSGGDGSTCWSVLNDSPHEETCFNRKQLEGCFIDLFHNGDQI